MESPSILERFVEPNYPITRVELFDDDNMKHILNDDRFNKNDRIRLSNYNKHRRSGSTIVVEYKLADEVNEYNIGRLYPTDGIGLQSFRFDIRNPLLEKWYWDIDMENSHPCIAEKICIDYDLQHQAITNYVNNRNEILSKISNDRKTAKTEILKILYGGDIKLYNNFYENQVGEIKQEGFEILNNLKREFNILQDEIWNRNSHLHKIKIGGKSLDKKPNKKSSLMALIFQTKERKLLMMIDFVLRELYNRQFSILIHDGGLIQKKEGENQFPQEILNNVSNIITQFTRIKTRLTQKRIEYEWQPIVKESPYENMKKEFEKKYFYIGSKIVYEMDNNELIYMSINDFHNKNKNLYWDERDGEKIRRQYFTEHWLEDKTRADYERIDFIPNVKDCPKNVYNKFKGFEVEKLADEFLNVYQADGTKITELYFSKDEIEIKIKPILDHLKILTGGEQNGYLFLLNILSNMIQNPHRRCEILVLFRDENGFIRQGGGNGKSLFFNDFFGNKIIGDKYTIEIQDNNDLYNTFNSHYTGKLLGIIEECGDGSHHRNENKLKNRITSKKIQVNPKGIQQYTMAEYITLFAHTNMRNSLPFKIGNRRMAVFDVIQSIRGNEEYFNTLVNHINDRRIQYYFYLYLKLHFTPYDSPIKFQNNIPINNAYKQMIQINAPLHLKWISYNVKNNLVKNDTIKNIYLDYIEWVKTNKETKDDSSIMSMTSFGTLLQSDGNILVEDDNKYCLLDVGNKKRNSKGIYYKWNIENLINGLKRIHMLDENFEYIYDECDSQTTEEYVDEK